MRLFQSKRRALALAAAIAAVQWLPSQAKADTYSWNNGNSDNLWPESGNWVSPSPFQSVPGNTDTAAFTDTGAGTVNLGASTDTIGTLTFSNTVSDYTFTSWVNGQSTLNVNTIDASNSTANITLDSTTALGETSVYLGNTGQTIQMITGSGTMEIDSQVTAPDGLSIAAGTSGQGAVVLSNGNNSIGTIEVNSGATLIAQGDNSDAGANVLGSAITNVDDGGVLQVSGTIQITDPVINDVNYSAIYLYSAGDPTILAIGSGAGHDTVTILGSGSTIANIVGNDATNVHIQGVTGTENLVVGSGVYFQGAYSITNLNSLTIQSGGLLSGNQSGQTVNIGTTGTAFAVDNQGEIDVDAGAMIIGSLANLSGNTLTGGNYSVFTTLQFLNAGQDIVTNAAAIQLYNGGQILDASGNDAIAGHLIENDGLLNLDNTNFSSVATFTNKGAFYTDGTATVTLSDVTNGRGTPSPGLIPAFYIEGGAINVSGTLNNLLDGVINVAGGDLSATQLNNAGDIEFTAGAMTATISNTGTLNVSQSGTHVLTGNLDNSGVVTVISTMGQPATNFVVTGNYTGTAAKLVLDPASIEVFDLNLDANSTITGIGTGSTVKVDGDFTDHSTTGGGDTDGVTIEFGSGDHTWETANGNSWEELDLDSGLTGLTIEGIDGFSGNIYIDDLVLPDTSSQMAIQDELNKLDLNGINLEYNENDPANSYLDDKTFTLPGGGELVGVSVPEPASLGIISIGALSMLARRRRRPAATS